jgi:integrase
MKWGRKKRLHNNLSFENFLPTPIDKSEVIFLNLDEIGAIEALKLSGVTELARDIFMFAYYAGGQRISDALSLKHKDIIIDETYSTGSWHLFQKKQKKTERIVIPLLDKAISYLKKYHRANSLGNSYVFPKLFESKIVHEQDLNEAIKEFCKDAGITQQHRSIKYSGHYERERIESKSQFISFKVARKSFVSNSLKLGMSPELIIKFTGHSTVKVMREHYLGISEDFKRETLFKFWQPKSEHEPETK